LYEKLYARPYNKVLFLPRQVGGSLGDAIIYDGEKKEARPSRLGFGRILAL
jgi:hypothetical protein